MNGFFKSVGFKIIIGIVIILFGFMLSAASTEGFSTFTSKAFDYISSPFREFASWISNGIGNTVNKYMKIDETYSENERLKKEIAELNTKLIDYEKYRSENEQFKKLLEMRERNGEMQFEPAKVISRDPLSRFGAFTIDRGSVDGVHLYDPVVTENNCLVGIVTKLNYTSSVVTTILDVSTNVPAYEQRTGESGNLTGDVALSYEGLCKMEYLERDSGLAIGDKIVTTSTSEIFPRGLDIGTVKDILPTNGGASLYAVIEPGIDINSVKEVFIVTAFEGKKNHSDASE